MAKNQSEEIRKIMLETARVQIAGLNAGIAFWSGWVERTAKFAQTANKELLAVGQQKADANQVISRLTESSREYLRQVAELPGLAASHFNAEIGKSRGTKRGRAARAKN